MFRRIALMGTLISASAAVGVVAARKRWHEWGIDPAETKRALPGDELVAEPTNADTRGIDIAAPLEQVWPWLVQMGYKRAGWYSYDAIDMNQGSNWEIVPEYQALEVGAVMPTHDGGGFVVKTVQPNKVLVLYLDSEIAREQERDHAGETTLNVQATGRFLSAAVPGEFAASWTFVLEPKPDGGTRLIERFRVRLEAPATMPATILGPILGFGVFTMTRRQMLGIRDRAQSLVRSLTTPPAPAPAPAAG